ncbi:MAG TPA: hypothetical protein ENK49_04455, partial [Gammaproteobacteria bacterium]|nr:hypothetical protein [Gammaproteobacteria bacterium]
MAQIIFYVVSPLVTLLAVLVAYIALVKQSRPHILVQYRPNPGIQSFIDLVVENIGNGMARNVQFSQPIPAQCFGIEKPDGEGGEALGGGFPAIAAGQQFIFDGGQYAGLKNRIGEMMEIQLTYEYMNPIGIRRKRKEACVLSITHLEGMPSRTNAEQAIVDALKSNNVTTLH